MYADADERNESSKQMERHHIHGLEDSTKDVNFLQTDNTSLMQFLSKY